MRSMGAAAVFETAWRRARALRMQPRVVSDKAPFTEEAPPGEAASSTHGGNTTHHEVQSELLGRLGLLDLNGSGHGELRGASGEVSPAVRAKKGSAGGFKGPR